MEILSDTEEALVVQDQALFVRAIGSGFALVGVFFVISALRDWSLMTLLMVPFGGVFLAVGLALAILPRTTTVRFDRIRGTVTLDTTGAILAQKHRELLLHQVREVLVREKKDSDGDHTFRVELTVEGEEPVPLSEVWVSDRTPQTKLKERVQDWIAGRPR